MVIVLYLADSGHSSLPFSKFSVVKALIDVDRTVNGEMVFNSCVNRMNIFYALAFCFVFCFGFSFSFKKRKEKKKKRN